MLFNVYWVFYLEGSVRKTEFNPFVVIVENRIETSQLIDTADQQIGFILLLKHILKQTCL